MRITGPMASEAYCRRYGKTDLDQDMAELLADGEIEYDTETEKFHVTHTGRLILYKEGVMH